MRLPENQIGISDIEDYRECPQRHAHGMRRHVELPERLQMFPGEKDDPPEHTNWTNAYGSAIHDCIHLVEKFGMGHEQAIKVALQRYGTYLEPGDIAMLREDLDVFERRRPLGVGLVASEAEARVPLFVHPEYGQMYFRFRLDVLHRLISNPSVFLHRDYKSSKWRRTPEEVHKNPQMWAYNWAIHELFPECTHLIQTYDQLRYGEVKTTKNDEQRRDMKQWLIDMVTVILADETYVPKLNDFCRYCPLVVTCREPRRATAHARGRISLLAPVSKEGRSVKVEFFAEGVELEEFLHDDLPQMIRTRKIIEHVEKAAKELIEGMSEDERERVGWDVTDRKRRAITPDGLRALHELMGDRFYSWVTGSAAGLEEIVGKPRKGEPLPPELQLARNYTTEEISGTNVVPAKSGD